MLQGGQEAYSVNGVTAGSEEEVFELQVSSRRTDSIEHKHVAEVSALPVVVFVNTISGYLVRLC